MYLNDAAAFTENPITRDQLKVASFNIRLDYAGDGANNLSYNANFLSGHFPVITLLEYQPI